MIPNNFFLQIESAQLSFVEKGEGENIILCTHGYRQTKEQFLLLFENLPAGWKMLAFDQPMHGSTIWQDKHLHFDADFLQKMWGELYRLYPNANWHLLGFSMGGKTAMMLQMLAKKPILKLILIAPGGVYYTPLNRFFSYHSVGKPIFRHLLRNPMPVIKGVEFAYKKKWMRNFQYRFMKAHFSQDEIRTFLLQFSYIYQYFDFPLAKLAEANKNKQTQVFLFWGTKDEVVTFDQSEIFLQYIPHTQLIVIEGRHNLIEENTVEMQEKVGKIVFF